MKSKMNIKGIIFFAIIVTVSAMFLNMSLASNNAKVIVETANVRKEASTESEILVQLSEDDEGEVLANEGEWCKVKFNGTTGYVKTALLSINSSEEDNKKNEEVANTTVSEQTNATSENVQTTSEVNKTEKGKYIVTETSKIKLVPLVNATDMIEVQSGKTIDVLKIMNGWAYVVIDNTKGWIRTEKIKTEAEAKAEADEKAKLEAEQKEAELAEADKNAPALKTCYVKTETVNLRKNPNTEAEIVGAIPQNTAVEVIENDKDGWTKCRVSGLIGYISTQYLTDQKVEVTSRSASASRQSNEEGGSSYSYVPSSGNGSSVVSYAEQFLGVDYVYGGSSPDTGFDCSGFTSYVYSNFGVSLPRTSGGQASSGVAVSDGDYQAGDLVVYSGHVAIYVGDGQVIHAPRPGKSVSIVPIDEAANGSYSVRRVM